MKRIFNKLATIIIYLITLLIITCCKEQVNTDHFVIGVTPTNKITPTFVSNHNEPITTPVKTPFVLRKTTVINQKTSNPLHDKEPYIFVRKIGSEGSGDGQFKNVKNINSSFLINIAVGKEGNLYTTDAGNNRIQKFDSKGNFILKWSTGNYTNKQMKYPNGIAVDTENNIYIAEDEDFFTKISRSTTGINENISSTPKEEVYNIKKFTCNGKFITKWTTKDPIPISDIIIGRDKKIYLVYSHCISKYASDGHFIISWDFPFSKFTYGNAYSMLCNTAIDTKNNIFILFKRTEPGNFEELSPDLENFIMKYTSDGHLIKKYKELHDNKKRVLKSCHDIAIDSEDNIFISGGVNYPCIFKFDHNLKFITKFGIETSNEGKLKAPQSIAVDSEGNVYVVDIGDFSIKKFTPKN